MKNLTFEIKSSTSEVELEEIIANNNPKDVANTFYQYIQEETKRWCDEYQRANRAEGKLAEMRQVLSESFLNLIKIQKP